MISSWHIVYKAGPKRPNFWGIVYFETEFLTLAFLARFLWSAEGVEASFERRSASYVFIVCTKAPDLVRVLYRCIYISPRMCAVVFPSVAEEVAAYRLSLEAAIFNRSFLHNDALIASYLKKVRKVVVRKGSTGSGAWLNPICGSDPKLLRSLCDLTWPLLRDANSSACRKKRVKILRIPRNIGLKGVVLQRGNGFVGGTCLERVAFYSKQSEQLKECGVEANDIEFDFQCDVKAYARSAPPLPTFNPFDALNFCQVLPPELSCDVVSAVSLASTLGFNYKYLRQFKKRREGKKDKQILVSSAVVLQPHMHVGEATTIDQDRDYRCIFMDSWHGPFSDF